MKDTIKLDLIELLESGKTYEESKEVQLIVDASAEALKFYNDYQVSKDQLTGFFDKDKLEASQDKMSAFLDKQLNETPANKDFSYKGFAAMAVAASALLISINIFSPEEALPIIDEEPVLMTDTGVAYEIVEELIIEEVYEPEFVNSSEVSSLWNAGSLMAKDKDITIHQAMYAIYKANPDAFNENNINELIADFELVLDDSLAFAVTPDFASDEVNRRVFCSC